MNRFTWHGGGIAAAKAHYGEGDWLDLSTGINPEPWPGADRVKIDWQALPSEDGLAELERKAAAHFGVDPAFVCALPGTEIGLRIVTGLLPEPAFHLSPSYRTHGDMLGGAAPLAREHWRDAAGGTLILANPNNPDGHVTAPERLAEMLAAGWLVVDEAFADTDPAIGMGSHVADDARLLIFRSFGKFFGLAGLRLGFAVGPRWLLAQIRARLGAWPVSAAAIAIGAAAYADRPWVEAMRERLRDRAAALDAVLFGAGHEPLGECPLFRLIATDDATALFERLARQAILTRPFDHDPRWLRFGVPGSDAQLQRLARALGDD
ncbi:MAG: aminotransferase class I/II-fold pyridoxal phosphate-dependent enzyme [Sphingobium sp.]